MVLKTLVAEHLTDNNNNNKFICQAPSHFMRKQINEVIDLTRC